MSTLIQSLGNTDKQQIIRDLMAQFDKGHQFSIVNVKADGSLREYKAMTNVKADLKGGESTTSHKKNLLTIYDTTIGQYRAVNLDTVLFIKFGEREFIFLDEQTSGKIADQSIGRSLQTAASVSDTVLKAVRKAIGI